MSLIREDCIDFNEKRPVCVAAENGKTYRLENKAGYKVRKVKVDGCLEMEAARRCDYLMSIDGQNRDLVYFIELKGGKLHDALIQVMSAMEALKDEFRGYLKNARIVGSRDVPGLTLQPAYKKLDRMVRETGGNIIYRTNKEYNEII